MNEKNTDLTPEPEEPKAGIPQDLADDVAQLAAEVSRMERSAARGWKITAVAFIILLAVIATYLNLLVYKPLKATLQPETVVQIGFDRMNEALAAYGFPSLDNAGMIPGWAAGKVKDMAPTVMNDMVKPRVDELLAQLPQRRQELVAQIKEQLPRFLDEQVEKLPAQYLPKARMQVKKRISAQLNKVLLQADEKLGTMVDEVIAYIGKDAEVLKEEGRLDQAFEQAFEERLGAFLDATVFVKLDKHVSGATKAMEDLVSTKSKTLEQQLEVRIIQIVRALFEKIGEPEAAAIGEPKREAAPPPAVPVGRPPTE